MRIIAIPGQVVGTVHASVSTSLPSHWSPSYFGAGSEQFLVRVHVPLTTLPLAGVHETEHVVHAFQVAQLPSTVKIRLTFTTSGKIQQTTNSWYIVIQDLFLNFHENRLTFISPTETRYMEWQSLFSGKNKKHISKCLLLNVLSSTLCVYYIKHCMVSLRT